MAALPAPSDRCRPVRQALRLGVKRRADNVADCGLRCLKTKHLLRTTLAAPDSVVPGIYARSFSDVKVYDLLCLGA